MAVLEDSIVPWRAVENPERTFLALFRVQRPSFWKLVERVKSYWETSEEQVGSGRTPRSIYQQFAVGMYIFLAGEGGRVEHYRVLFNIGYGTVIE